MLVVVVFQHKGVGFEDGHLLKHLRMLVEQGAQHSSRIAIETAVGVANPLLDDAACDFLVVVIKDGQLARLLIHLQVDVGEQARLFACGKLFGHFSQGSFQLLQCLFCRFHRRFIFRRYKSKQKM